MQTIQQHQSGRSSPRGLRGARSSLPLLAGIAVGIAAAGAGLALADLDSSLRAPLTLFFLLVAPGAAIAAALPGLDPLSRTVVALIGSVAVNLLVAQVLIATQTWSARTGVVTIAVISSLAFLIPLLRTGTDQERD